MQSCLEEHQGQTPSYFLHQPENLRTPEPGIEPMQVDSTQLPFTERQRWLTQGLGGISSPHAPSVLHALCSGELQLNEKQSVGIPACYAPFNDIFCPKRASLLPPHRPWDCAIGLIPGEPVPHGKIYPLSLPEQKAMEEYIEEALQQGYICPSTFPTASSSYPLPLVPAALEALCGATVFTKLDLCSAYNLNRIREGDEWKTAFVTPTGHYEVVMPYGLVNAPSVFQDFMHKVLREYLHRFVLVYIDGILIY
ncbi:hypothetical protein PO909_007516 [Leuciscus waleckii]